MYLSFRKPARSVAGIDTTTLSTIPLVALKQHIASVSAYNAGLLFKLQGRQGSGSLSGALHM